VAAVALAAVVIFGAAADAQGPRQALPSLVPESLVGSVSFDLYCASCHGRLGKGDGPTASSLRIPPADLTALAQQSGGTFSRERFFAFVEGSSRAAAHGGSEMPVWGPTLRALDASDARVTVRLRNLAAFVESIQEPSRVTPSRPRALDGASLFAASCSTCHGASGRGDGAMAGQMRRTPPNLVTFASRNGGVFPSERLRQIVDGTGIASHGDRDMPVWGAVFKRSASGRDDAAARIDAIVKFLETLQERQAE
jgi:mono/diheme cytochrome c family protein